VTSSGGLPILRSMETPETPPRRSIRSRAAGRADFIPSRIEGIWGIGERLTWVSALVLTVSAFTGWYVGTGEGLTLSVIGWHTGILGQLVFFIGLVVLALVALREAGIDLPASVPESLVVLALGSLATIFVLIRLVDIPERFLPADGRGVGIWISLVAALGVIVAGLLEAAEEL
jgi:hypothetical protein